jgi:hypothetical protein
VEAVGIFSNPIGIFYGQWVNFMAIRYILRYFGTFFSRFGMFYQEKSGNPGPSTGSYLL